MYICASRDPRDVADLEGQLRYIAGKLGIAIAEKVWPAASRFHHPR
jgi:hypothetical protein